MSPSSLSSSRHFNTGSFMQYKEDGKRIVMCTAYDVTQARLLEAAGVDTILVGDSLGMTTLGYDSTLPVTMDDMLRATTAVTRGAPSTYVVADMPFMSYQASYEDGMHNAGLLMARGGAQAVKVEGASSDTLVLVEGLVGAGIPVVGHLGLTPQSVNTLGGYRVQAKESTEIIDLFSGAHFLMSAGICALVVECVPAEVAQQLQTMFAVPIIGIGAGVHCDGEVQVFHDVLGLDASFTPRHAKRFTDGAQVLGDALEEYVQSVRARTFPGEEQTTHVEPEVVEEASGAFARFMLEDLDQELEEMLEVALERGRQDDTDLKGSGDDSSGGDIFPGGFRASYN
jgi:3-methyl-2-oxobutanoate hydroxymethyltransferase